MDLSNGDPGTVTALGMGTVFVCLILLYVTMLGLGRLMAPKRETAPAPESSAAGTAVAAVPPKADDHDAILAAMTLVLARHRAVRAQSTSATAVGNDSWKIAGRIQMLRNS